MKTTTIRRIILSLDPYLLTTALAAWLQKELGVEVVIDRSGVSIPTADPSDVVVANRLFDSRATVLVISPDGTNVSVHRSGHVESYRYEGLDALTTLIGARRCG